MNKKPTVHDFKRPLKESLNEEVSLPEAFALIRSYLRQKWKPTKSNSDITQLVVRAGIQESSRGMSWTVENLVDILEFRIRKGEKDAAEALLSVASYATSRLKELSSENPKKFALLARDRVEWPSNISFHPDWAKENAMLVKALKLGSQVSLKGKMKVTKFPAPQQPFRAVVHVYCFKLVEIIEILKGLEDGLKDMVPAKCLEMDWGEIEEQFLVSAWKLPSLQKSSAKKWFDVAWEILTYFSDGHPEKLPALALVGAYKKMHTAGKEGADPGKATMASNMRAGLKFQLQRAFLIRFG